jgi:hypothetical protein
MAGAIGEVSSMAGAYVRALRTLAGSSARLVGSGSFVGSPHQIVCRTQGFDDGEAGNIIFAKFIEPVQNDQSFLQNTPNANGIARFVEQDSPPCYEFLFFHLF